MPNIRACAVTLAASACAVVAGSVCAQPDWVTFETLDRIDGFSGPMYPMGINGLGQICGEARFSSGSAGAYPFVSESFGSSVGVIPPPDGWAHGRADDINSRGQLAVTAIGVGGGSFLSYRYTPGVGYEEIGALSGDRSAPEAINEAGQVTGWNDSPQRAYRFSDAGLEDLGVPDGRDDSAGLAINDLGQVAGFANGSFGSRAFLYSDGSGFRDLGTFPGGRNYVARGVNNAGEVVGSMQLGGVTTPFLWSESTGIVPLPKLDSERYSQVWDINNMGWAVGVSQRSGGGEAGVLWKDGELIDLEQLVGGGVQLLDAVAINDAGQITGSAIVDGERLVYRLTIPAPGSTLPLVIGGLVIARRSRRRSGPGTG